MRALILLSVVLVGCWGQTAEDLTSDLDLAAMPSSAALTVAPAGVAAGAFHLRLSGGFL